MQLKKKKPTRLLNASGRHLYGIYRRSAEKRGLLFDITHEEFCEITMKPCYICGARPKAQHRPNKKHGWSFKYNGIDRVVNTRGYYMGNVHACCKTCNYAKSGHSLVVFLQYIRRCYKFAIEPYLNQETSSHEVE